MTDPVGVKRESPTRSPVAIEDLTLLVRVPGTPNAVRAFTDAQRPLAEAYADAHGGVVVDLPLPRPDAVTD